MNKTKTFLLIYIFIFLMFFSIFSSCSYAASDVTTYSPSCILLEKQTGKILYEKNAYEVRYPASTTKIMTAILTVEKCELTDVATVSHNAIFTVPVSYSHASLKEGEEVTVEQLLNVLLIPSANDAANVLAEHISGSVDDFADLMNEKAKEIGCLNTHFVNPNGVYHKDHTTTAYDLALMGRYAMQNSTIREIVKKTSYSLPATNKYDKTDRRFNTTNDLIRVNNSNAKDNYYYPNAIGIKTGYTTEAGSCIIAAAEKDGLEVVCVVLGGGSTDGLSERYLDCIHLFDYAFDNYKMQTIHEQNSVVDQIAISGATSDTKNLNLLAKDNVSLLLSKDESKTLTPEITLNENLKAPISANTVVGKVTYHIGEDVYSSDLIAETSVLASGVFPILLRIVLILVTIYLIYLLLRKPKSGKGSKSTNKKKHKKHSKNSSKGRKRNRGSGHFLFTSLNNF